MTLFPNLIKYCGRIYLLNRNVLNKLQKNVSQKNVIVSQCRRYSIGLKKEEPGKAKGPITWKSFAITAVLGGGLMAFMYYLKHEKEQVISIVVTILLVLCFL